MGLLEQTRKGVYWTFLKQFSIQGINFIVQLFLARLLVPEDFGLIAMITVFIAIGQSLMDSGMTNSLIRFPKVSNIDYSTVFWTNIIVSLLVYTFVFFLAPHISEFYNQSSLKTIIRVFSLSFVISSFNAVQVAKFTRELNFKKQFVFQFPSIIIGAIIGLGLAFYGYGVWSLVFLNLSQLLSFVLITWCFSDWRPTFCFDTNIFKKHFSYGYKLTLSGLIDVLYQNLYKILIGKNFHPSNVGFFSQADNLRLFPVNQVSAVLDKVTFPVFSKIKDDIKLRLVFKSAMKIVLSISSCLMIMLILIAEPLFEILLGEKWLPAVYYFQILCIASIMRPIGAYNLNILKVKGRSDLFLKVEVIKKVIGVISIVLSIPFGIEGLVWGLCITNVFFAYFNGMFSGRFINYSVKEQLRDTLPILLIAILPIFLCLFTQRYFFNNHSYLDLVCTPVLYIIQFGILTIFLNKSVVDEVKYFLKKDIK